MRPIDRVAEILLKVLDDAAREYAADDAHQPARDWYEREEWEPIRETRAREARAASRRPARRKRRT